MTTIQVASRLTDLAAELRARATGAPAYTLRDARDELRAAGVNGDINLNVSTSDHSPEWTVWAGSDHHTAPTLAGAMAAWRASRGTSPLAEAESVVAPLIADDAVVPIGEPGEPTIGEPATTVLG